MTLFVNVFIIFNIEGKTQFPYCIFSGKTFKNETIVECGNNKEKESFIFLTVVITECAPCILAVI